MANILLPTPTGIDDTAALQAMLTANPSNVEFDGQGMTYKTSAVLLQPSGSWVTLKNASFELLGDHEFIRPAPNAIVNFCKFSRVFVNAPNHTSEMRRVFTFSQYRNALFEEVWVNGVAGKTVAYHGLGYAGTAGYYNRWSGGYIGNIKIGIMMDDAPAPAQGANSNTIEGVRIQPGRTAGKDNIAVYLGKFTQNNRVQAWIESSQGLGIYIDGEGNTVDSGCRFESLTSAVVLSGFAKSNGLLPCYVDSCATKLSASPAVLAANPWRLGW